MKKNLFDGNGEEKMKKTILHIESLQKKFGGLVAVNIDSLDIYKNSITGLIGPNGAGKTTLFNVVCGNLRPENGDVYFLEEKITSLKTFQIARLGIGRVFQISRIFKGLSVRDNLFLVPSKNTNLEVISKRIESLLNDFGLLDFSDNYAGILSYGQQRMLEFARILMIDPKIILIDEPFSGLNPGEVEKLIKIIRKLNSKTDITFLIIDHAVNIVLGLCERVVVLDQGKIIADGLPHEIEKNERVIEAYLGRPSDV